MYDTTATKSNPNPDVQRQSLPGLVQRQSLPGLVQKNAATQNRPPRISTARNTNYACLSTIPRLWENVSVRT